VHRQVVEQLPPVGLPVAPVLREHQGDVELTLRIRLASMSPPQLKVFLK